MFRQFPVSLQLLIISFAGGIAGCATPTDTSTTTPTGTTSTTSTTETSTATGTTSTTGTTTITGVAPPLGWRVLPNSPIGGYWNHDDVFFIDENIGWIADISGNIYKTTDGGENWEHQVDNEGTSYRALAFLDDQTGFVGTLGPGSWVDNHVSEYWQTTDNALLYYRKKYTVHFARVFNVGLEAVFGWENK